MPVQVHDYCNAPKWAQLWDDDADYVVIASLEHDSLASLVAERLCISGPPHRSVVADELVVYVCCHA